jgi:hypothetical protein
MALRSCFPSAPISHIDLRFLSDIPEYYHTKPYYISGALPKEHEPSRTNIQYQMRHQIPVFNVRGEEHRIIIAKHGFQLLRVSEDVVSLDVRGSQKQEYIESITNLAKELLGAPFGLCYDCRVLGNSFALCIWQKHRFRSSGPAKETSHDNVVGTADLPDCPAEAAHIGGSL